MDSEGRHIFVIDARPDGKLFIVPADEQLAAFVELEAAIHPGPRRHKAPTARAPHDAQLSAPALQLPTPRATG